MKYILYFFEWIIEFLLIAAHFPCYILLKYIHMRPKQQDDNLPVIILVERWFRKNVFHYYAKQYLEKKGFKIYSVNFPLVQGSFESSGTKLKEYIEARKLQNIVLIGISGGSLTCLEYLQNKNGWKYVSRFISLAGPFKGTWAAKLFPVDHSIREMETNSSYVTQLLQEPIKNKDKIYSIRAVADNMVPVKSSIIPGVHNIKIDVVGHNLLHGFWAPTYKKVAEIAKLP